MLLALTGIGFIPHLIMYCFPGKPERNRFGERGFDKSAPDAMNVGSGSQNCPGPVRSARPDPAGGERLVRSREELMTLTETSVAVARQLGDGSWNIVVAVRNMHEAPVRLAGLAEKRQVQLIDRNGFAHNPKAGLENEVTVPERASAKVEFVFPELDGSIPKPLRIYGAELEVPEAVLFQGSGLLS